MSPSAPANLWEVSKRKLKPDEAQMHRNSLWSGRNQEDKQVSGQVASPSPWTHRHRRRHVVFRQSRFLSLRAPECLRCPGGFQVLLYPSGGGGDEEAPEGGQMKPDKQMSAVIAALQRADGRTAGIQRGDMMGVGLFPGGGKLKGTDWRED